MTQCIEEIQDIIGHQNAWAEAKKVIGDRRVLLGPSSSQQWLDAPGHLAMVLARYRAAAALIGDADRVVELGCGEGIGAGILAMGRREYVGLDPDQEAVEIADAVYDSRPNMQFAPRDAAWLGAPGRRAWFGAAVMLDVVEHLTPEMVDEALGHMLSSLIPDGVCVIGTPNAAFEHLASPQSKAGHINLYTHDQLHALMASHFRVVQSFGLQDTSLHLGHPDARHYHLAVGIGPK